MPAPPGWPATLVLASESPRGSVTNVIGLPMAEVHAMFRGRG
jgi:predicted house-cleaning NTP pyrophosphatase (Maf/HAM1 superfamily)